MNGNRTRDTRWDQGPTARSGFTLVELLVVIAIIGILVTLLLPAVNSAREAARRIQCSSNVRQLALAALNYESAKNTYPDGLTTYKTSDWHGNSMFAFMLPYMEETALADQWDYDDTLKAARLNRVDRSTGQENLNALSATVIGTLVCASDVLPENPALLDYRVSGYATGYHGISSYVGNGGTYSTYFRDPGMQSNGMFCMTGPDSKPVATQADLKSNQKPFRVAQVTDGTSHTLLFGERYHLDQIFDEKLSTGGTLSRYPIAKWGAWGWTGGGNGTTHLFCSAKLGVPINYTTPVTTSVDFAAVNRRMSAFGSGHPGGANFSYGDGSAQFISDSIDLITYAALTTREGGETITQE